MFCSKCAKIFFMKYSLSVPQETPFFFFCILHFVFHFNHHVFQCLFKMAFQTPTDKLSITFPPVLEHCCPLPDMLITMQRTPAYIFSQCPC